MKRALPLLSLLIILIGCSKSDSGNESPQNNQQPVEEPQQAVNNAPVLADQEFTVPENSQEGTLVGIVVASDADGDQLSFIQPATDGVYIDPSTGELFIGLNSLLFDYETNTVVTFSISVTDGDARVTAEVTILITDEDDGPLTNFEKEVVQSFLWQTLYGTTDFPLYKRTESVSLYLEGEITIPFENIVHASIIDFNSLFEDGFEIKVADAQEDSNVHLYVSSLDDLSLKWPDLYEFALTSPGLGGIAAGDRVWIANYARNTGTFKHEMGHIIGLGHTPENQCKNTIGFANSNMCGGVGLAGPDFIPLDLLVIRLLYHPNIPNGLPGIEVENRLIETILSLR